MNIDFKAPDEDQISLVLEFMQGLYETLGIDFDPATARRAVDELRSQPAFGRLWLIYDEACPVGYLALMFGYSLEFGGRDAILDELYVRPDARRHGVGTSALHFVEAFCREEGVRAVHLEVWTGNQPALSMYRKFGFEHHDSYWMTRRLARSGPNNGND